MKTTDCANIKNGESLSDILNMVQAVFYQIMGIAKSGWISKMTTKFSIGTM